MARDTSEPGGGPWSSRARSHMRTLVRPLKATGRDVHHTAPNRAGGPRCRAGRATLEGLLYQTHKPIAPQDRRLTTARGARRECRSAGQENARRARFCRSHDGTLSQPHLRERDGQRCRFSGIDSSRRSYPSGEATRGWTDGGMPGTSFQAGIRTLVSDGRPAHERRKHPIALSLHVRGNAHEIPRGAAMRFDPAALLSRAPARTREGCSRAAGAARTRRAAPRRSSAVQASQEQNIHRDVRAGVPKFPLH